jgi:transposase
MPSPYSIDLRERAMKARKNHTQAEVARTFGIGVRTLQEWEALERNTGQFAATPWGGGRPPKITAAQQAAMEAEIEKRPDITLEELQIALALPITVSAICMRLIKAGLHLKKRRSLPANATAPTSKSGAGHSKKKPKASRLKG